MRSAESSQAGGPGPGWPKRFGAAHAWAEPVERAVLIEDAGRQWDAAPLLFTPLYRIRRRR